MCIRDRIYTDKNTLYACIGSGEIRGSKLSNRSTTFSTNQRWPTFSAYTQYDRPCPKWLNFFIFCRFYDNLSCQNHIFMRRTNTNGKGFISSIYTDKNTLYACIGSGEIRGSKLSNRSAAFSTNQRWDHIQRAENSAPGECKKNHHIHTVWQALSKMA